jgi:hypothetical protein
VQGEEGVSGAGRGKVPEREFVVVGACRGVALAL